MQINNVCALNSVLAWTLTFSLPKVNLTKPGKLLNPELSNET